MAPVCMARRPRLSDPLLFCVFLLFLSLLLNHADSLLTYDHETLLNIQTSVDGQDSFPPPLLSGVPHHLDYSPTPSHKKKRFKRRRKRSGLLVKLKSYLALSSGRDRTVSNALWQKSDLCTGLSSHVASWNLSAPGWSLWSARLRRSSVPAFSHLVFAAVNPQNLWPLKPVPWMAVTGLMDPTRIALVNARSLANKTFMLISSV